MKGNKNFPQCGFSNTAVMILKSIPACGEDFETFDVLADNEIREGIKKFSSWPTIPQVCLCFLSARAAFAPEPAMHQPHYSRTSHAHRKRDIGSLSAHARPRPQMYIDGEFIGGCDILIEMYQAGELQEIIEKAKAS